MVSSPHMTRDQSTSRRGQLPSVVRNSGFLGILGSMPFAAFVETTGYAAIELSSKTVLGAVPPTALTVATAQEMEESEAGGRLLAEGRDWMVNWATATKDQGPSEGPRGDDDVLFQEICCPCLLKHR